jgi:enolase
VNEAKFKVSEGSLGDEFNSLESAQNYLNDAYSLIKAKNWDEIILSLQNSQTDAMTMLSEEADSEDSDDILSYLQDLHETYEACVFDIVVYNFLYNAGAEFESLQW